MKKINSFIYACLLSITITLSVFCLTILSDNFILKVIRDNNYYTYIENATNIKLDTIKKDLNNFIKNQYRLIKLDNEEYSKYINFIKIEKKQIYFIYFITIIFILLTGNIFIKTKSKHNLDVIFIISSILLIIIYGIVFLTFDSNYILNIIVNYSNHFLLFIAVLLLMIVISKKVLKKHRIN